ncbi:histone-lysine N-methyltransferase ASHH3-like [Phragmites australis]|uniref:histone-lysine N-methyltransferase ASHH3-like n=1 Tax=Phragmites australis TaxID=29695 RepID=UPI002D778691|nr:histone-lysine N-methyltransferase ASHH3-like [Phragmites australis]
MVRAGSSSSARKVNQAKQVENVFEELISKIEPAEFDLPPVLKQWKLGYYVPIKRNVYRTKRRIEDYGIYCSCTPSSGSSVACDKDCQCGMLFSCCSSNCNCDNTCANKSFQHRPLKKTKLIKTEKCGFGLVAEDEIKKGEFVIEYVGEVIDDKTCEERLWKMKRLGDTNFYLCEVSSNMVIDATDKGNMSRFINHSCEPNTEMQKWTVDGETRVGIFALRDIKKGEELTYDYKFVQFGAGQDCHCGSSNCRKMLGTMKSTKSVNSTVLHNGNSGSSQDQPVRKKKKTKCENCLGQFLRLWHPREKMYLACWVYDFDQETKLHTLQFCDLHTEKFNLKEEDWAFLPDPDDPTDESE